MKTAQPKSHYSMYVVSRPHELNLLVMNKKCQQEICRTVEPKKTFFLLNVPNEDSKAHPRLNSERIQKKAKPSAFPIGILIGRIQEELHGHLHLTTKKIIVCAYFQQFFICENSSKEFLSENLNGSGCLEEEGK